MEKEFACKRLEAIYQEPNMFLSGSHNSHFTINKETPITVNIEQDGIRSIIITTEKDITQRELYTVLTNVEKLLMLFNGRFICLSKLIFSDSRNCIESQLSVYAEHMINRRLSYFNSADFCKIETNSLIEYDLIISEELYAMWEKLLDELDVVNQMYLYALSDSGMPVDLKCAFLIELCEPLIEVIKEHKKFFTSLTPGERGTSLKNCIDALITKYGVDIFAIEIEKGYEQVLSVLVNSRNRIMHIKRRQQKLYLDKNESIIYINKISLLYRHILFQVLDIDEELYHSNLIRSVKKWNGWDDILIRFLNKLKAAES